MYVELKIDMFNTTDFKMNMIVCDDTHHLKWCVDGKIPKFLRY